MHSCHHALMATYTHANIHSGQHALQCIVLFKVGGTQFLDLGTAHTLETELRAMMDSVDELNQESIKFNKHQNMVLKQYQEKTRWIQKRQLENQARSTRGEVRGVILIIFIKMS